MSFAERLDHLIKTVHPASRGPLSHAEISGQLAERGHHFTTSYISQLRRGDRGKTGVSAELVFALADLFGVDPRYFYDDQVAADTDKDLKLLAAVRDAGVERIATRSMGLSAESIEAVDGLIDHLRKVEGMRTSGKRDKHRRSRHTDTDDDTD